MERSNENIQGRKFCRLLTAREYHRFAQSVHANAVLMQIARPYAPCEQMHHATVFIILAVCCYLAPGTVAEEEATLQLQSQLSPNLEDQVDGSDAVHTREKRTLFLKKKLLGAGLLGFGLGIAKG